MWFLLCFIFVGFTFAIIVDAGKIKSLRVEIQDVTEILMKQVSVSSYPIKIASLDTISPVLVYRYPEFSCNICYQDDLELLRVLKNEIGKDCISILPAYRKNRNNGILLRNELADFNFINVESAEEIPLFESDNVIHRYFAVYEKGTGFKMIYFPDRAYPQLTKDYLQNIKAKYYLEL